MVDERVTREPGFYWVRVREVESEQDLALGVAHDEWQVAQWANGCWFVIGVERALGERAIEQVGPRVHHPVQSAMTDVALGFAVGATGLIAGIEAVIKGVARPIALQALGSVVWRLIASHSSYRNQATFMMNQVRLRDGGRRVLVDVDVLPLGDDWADHWGEDEA